MVFNNPATNAFFTLLLASVTTAKIEITVPCPISDEYETYTHYSFYLAADKITASAGSIDIDEEFELGALWSAECNWTDIAPLDINIESGPYAVTVFFNTSMEAVKVEMKINFTVSDVVELLVRINHIGVTFFGSPGTYATELSEKEIKALGWDSPSFSVPWMHRKKGYMCPKSHVQLGKQNSIEIDNLRIVLLKRGKTVPTRDEDYEVCKKSTPEPKPQPGMASWAIFAIVIGAGAIVCGLVYGGYRLYQAKKGY